MVLFEKKNRIELVMRSLKYLLSQTYHEFEVKHIMKIKKYILYIKKLYNIPITT